MNLIFLDHNSQESEFGKNNKTFKHACQIKLDKIKQKKRKRKKGKEWNLLVVRRGEKQGS
jgi:hypothetical protein